VVVVIVSPFVRHFGRDEKRTSVPLRTGCRDVAAGVARSIPAMLEIRMLGPVEVVLDGAVVRLTPTQLLLVAVLAARHPEPVASDVLVDAVWGEDPPPSAVTSLRAQISRVRRVLGEHAIASDGRRYRLGVHRSDVTELEAALRVGDAQSLDQACDLLRGPPLGQLDSPVLAIERRRLEELRTQLEDRHAQSLLRRGRHSEAVTRLQVLVEEDPLREERWRGLAEALAGMGRTPEALRSLHRCREVFADVGLDTTPDLAALEDVLLGAAPPVSAVPAVTRLVGRDEDVERVRGLLGSARLVTLAGPPGVGKTSLARAIAPDGHMVWCDLSGLEVAADVPAAVCRAVQAPLVAPYQETLASFFALRPMTVVLDNCEQVIEGVAALITSLLMSSADVKFLATSREPLRVAAERVHRVKPLDSASSGPELFRLRMVELGVDPVDVPDADVVRLCRGLDGLPLAIEMAASRTVLLGFEPTLRFVEQAAGGLDSDRRDADDRHRSLAALVDSSLDGLSAEGQALLGRLAAFVDDFDSASAHAVLALREERETLAYLADWCRRSLLELEGDGRFRMLFTIRHRLIERAGGDFGVAVRTHAEHHAAVAEHLSSVPFGPNERAQFDRLDELVSELRAATFRSAEEGNFELASRIARALFQYAYTRIRADVAEWAERLLAMPGFAEHPSESVLRLAALGAMHRGELPLARAYCERAVARSESPVDSGFALHLLAEVWGYQGERQKMFDISAEAIRIADSLGHPLLTTLGLQNQMLADAYQGRRSAALARVPGLRRSAELLDSEIQRGWASFCEGEVLIESDPDAALPLLDEAVQLARRGGADFLEGVAMATVASLRARHGDPSLALDTFATTIRRFRDRGNWVHQRVVIRNLAALLAHTGLYRDAAVLLSALSDDVAAVGGPERDRLDAAWNLAMTAEDAGEAVADGVRMDPNLVVEFALAATERANHTLRSRA
jgi:predicted ATPase/DNA-binding SARP family transcriptional activator